MKKRTRILFMLTLGLLFTLLSRVCSGQILEDYINKGLKNSPFLKDYSIRLQSQVIDSLKVLAGFKPQAGVSSDIIYPPAIGKFAYDSAITDGGHYAALVRINQPLFYKRTAQARLQSVFIQKLSTRNNYKITESELREAISAQYITAFADFSQYQFEKVILNMLRDQQNTLRILVEKAIYQQTDFLNLTVSISARTISAKQAHRQYKNDLAILNLLCGIHDTASVVLTKPDLKIRNSFDINESPNMIQFRIDSLKSINEHLLIDLDYRPRVGAFADAGINAVNPRRIPYNLGTSFGLSLVMPLYDGKQRQLEHKKVELSENSRALFRSSFENHYQEQKDQLLEQLRLTDDILQDIKNQISGLEKLISLYKVEINQGMVRWIDFLNIVNNYAQAGNELTQAEINRLQIINQLNYLK